LVVVPTGKVAPLGKPVVCCTLAPGQLSAAVTLNVTLLREH
jgi:hypothetical protein